jgi:hypothetical protein
VEVHQSDLQFSNRINLIIITIVSCILITSIFNEQINVSIHDIIIVGVSTLTISHQVKGKGKVVPVFN